MPRKTPQQKRAILRNYLAAFTSPAGQEVLADMWEHAKAAIRQCPDEAVCQARVVGQLQQLLMIEDAMETAKAAVAVEEHEVR